MERTPPSRLIVGQLLTPATIELQLRADHRDAVLEELVNRISELAGVPEARQALLHALREREQLCSTGIGDGVALPHARNAIVGLVKQPVLVFGRHPRGVPFGAIDNVPARLFFLLVAPNVSQHLQILARLSRMLRDPRLRQQLLVADRPEKVTQLIRDAEAGL